MAILTSGDLIGFYPEFADWDTERLSALLSRANIYVEGQVLVPEPVPDDLKLATAMVAKRMSQERRVKSVSQGDYSESYADGSDDPMIEEILSKYRKGRGQKLWMI